MQHKQLGCIAVCDQRQGETNCEGFVSDEDGFGVWGLGFWVWVLGFGFWVLGFRIEFKVEVL